MSAGPRGSDSPEAFLFDHFGLFNSRRAPMPGSPALNPHLNPALSLGRAEHASELTDVRTSLSARTVFCCQARCCQAAGWSAPA